jgi:AraC-like DNA-binding protein
VELPVRPARLRTAEIERHYHPRPYATLVLEGGYEEAGDQGRLEVAAGDVLLHPAFSAHRDTVRQRRTYVLDLPLPFDGTAWPSVARLANPDLLIRVAGRDLREAQQLLLERLSAVSFQIDDPADRLAAALSDEPSLPIGEWARSQGHSREWLSRRFSRLYGVDTALFRAEARARRAWRRIIGSEEPLALIAASCEFADQSHMTRAIVRLTGRSPRAWRQDQSVTSVQEERRGAR